MRRIRLGRTEEEISAIGLGTWPFSGPKKVGRVAVGWSGHDDERARGAMERAWELGVDHWDTADVYGAGESERRIGHYVQKHDANPIVATKVGRAGELYPDQYTKATVRENIEGSARRLGTDSVDLVQLHCIPPNVMFAGDIFEWLEDFRSDGLIRAYGVSVETLEEAVRMARRPFTTAYPSMRTRALISRTRHRRFRHRRSSTSRSGQPSTSLWPTSRSSQPTRHRSPPSCCGV